MKPANSSRSSHLYILHSPSSRVVGFSTLVDTPDTVLFESSKRCPFSHASYFLVHRSRKLSACVRATPNFYVHIKVSSLAFFKIPLKSDYSSPWCCVDTRSYTS